MFVKKPCGRLKKTGAADMYIVLHIALCIDLFPKIIDVCCRKDVLIRNASFSVVNNK